jgi:hypothetical protein
MGIRGYLHTLVLCTTAEFLELEHALESSIDRAQISIANANNVGDQGGVLLYTNAQWLCAHAYALEPNGINTQLRTLTRPSCTTRTRTPNALQLHAYVSTACMRMLALPLLDIKHANATRTQTS